MFFYQEDRRVVILQKLLLYCVEFSVFSMFCGVTTEITVEILRKKTLDNQIPSLIISAVISFSYCDGFSVFQCFTCWLWKTVKFCSFTTLLVKRTKLWNSCISITHFIFHYNTELKNTQQNSAKRGNQQRGNQHQRQQKLGCW